MTEDTQELFTIREVASVLRVDPATIRRYIKQGILEAIKLPSVYGRKQGYRIKRETLDKLLGNQS